VAEAGLKLDKNSLCCATASYHKIVAKIYLFQLWQVKWTRYKTSKGLGADGEKETLHHNCSGTIIEFLDELEGVYKKFVYHRYILKRTRDSNTAFERQARHTAKQAVSFDY
jgi:hypothetical protein